MCRLHTHTHTHTHTQASPPLSVCCHGRLLLLFLTQNFLVSTCFGSFVLSSVSNTHLVSFILFSRRPFFSYILCFFASPFPPPSPHSYLSRNPSLHIFIISCDLSIVRSGRSPPCCCSCACDYLDLNRMTSLITSPSLPLPQKTIRFVFLLLPTLRRRYRLSSSFESRDKVGFVSQDVR